ncbi:MAG: bifunctional adenosylcobinamide kinase/adenosylcobinamide-phosphate guanylyltransferase [Firmicutes bacterium]|nr:bifunctional adenosylcobinamide kinase/adenosylcobinamide-phosphate guanylyltransferase [Bacillota bacterium]
MLALVLGGAASGKSEYAEALAMSLNAERFYIATMQSYDAESERRIARHREMRRHKGFTTVERALDLEGLHIEHHGGVALLECASTLLGNELCLPGGAAENSAASILAGVLNLRKQGLNLVVVSNDVFAEGLDYSPEMTEYVRQLGLLNRSLAAEADCVVEVVCGLPLYHKGEPRLVD